MRKVCLFLMALILGCCQMEALEPELKELGWLDDQGRVIQADKAVTRDELQRLLEQLDTMRQREAFKRKLLETTEDVSAPETQSKELEKELAAEQQKRLELESQLSAAKQKVSQIGLSVLAFGGSSKVKAAWLKLDGGTDEAVDFDGSPFGYDPIEWNGAVQTRGSVANEAFRLKITGRPTEELRIVQEWYGQGIWPWSGRLFKPVNFYVDLQKNYHLRAGSFFLQLSPLLLATPEPDGWETSPFLLERKERWDSPDEVPGRALEGVLWENQTAKGFFSVLKQNDTYLVGGTVKTPLAAGLDIDFGTVEMIRRAERPLAGWPGNKVVSCTLSWQPRASLSLLGQWAGSSFDDGSLPELDFLTGKARYVELAIGDENRKLKVENWRVDPDFISIGAQSPSQTLLTVQDPLDALTIQGNPLEEADLELAPFGIASANRMGSRLTVQLPLGNNTIAFMLSRGAQIRPSYEELDQSGAIQSIPQQLIHYGERKTRFTLDVSKVIKGATLELALGSVRTSRDDDANTTVSELIKKDQAVFEVGLNVNRLAVGFRQVKAEGCNEQFGLLKFKQNVAADYAMEWKYQLARRVRSPQTEFFGQLGTCSLNIDF